MNRPSHNIVLIGFASTGKSTTGRVLANQLGWQFIDIDDVVERLHIKERGEKRRCREIFSLFGRDCFINYESQALDELATATNTVIATGGGTPISEENRARTQDLGFVVYLDAQVSSIFRRMSIKGYPQYLGTNPTITDLQRLWNQRNPIYRELADLVVDNTTLTPEDASNLITEHMKNLVFSISNTN